MDEKLLSPEHLAKMITKAKKEWIPFAFGFGGEAPRLVMHASKDGKNLFSGLKSASDVKKGGWGVCSTANRVLTLNFEKELSGAKSKAKAWIKESDSGLNKVVILVQGVPFVDPEDPEDVEAHEAERGDGGHDHDHDHDHEHKDHDSDTRYQAGRSNQELMLSKDPALWEKYKAEHAKTVRLVEPVLKKYPDRKIEILREVAFANQCFKDQDLEALRIQWEKLRSVAKEMDRLEKLADEIEKNIPDYTSNDSDDISRKYIDKMSKEDIRNLPTRAKILMIKSMQDGNYSDEDKAAVKKMFSINYLDPKFEQADEKKRKDLAQKLEADPELKKAKKDWATLDVDKRKQVLQKVADMMADTYGVPKTTIEMYNKPKDDDGSVENGYYNHRDGKLHLNSNADSAFGKGMERIMSTVVHENAHRYQATLVEKLDKGTIKEGDAEYEQAWLFKLNNKDYIQPGTDEYFTQPMETHSRMSGGEIERTVASW